MYNIEVDTHCHTLVSNHAKPTVKELIKQAHEVGLKGICITNHGPLYGDAPPKIHFTSLRMMPKIIDGVEIFKGAEANIINYNGLLDLDNTTLSSLDWVIAAMHNTCLEPSNSQDITNAYLQVIKNPYVNVLGHIGQKRYLCDYESIVKNAKKYNKVIEINNSSLCKMREGSETLCPYVLELCKRYKVNIVVCSDAHCVEQIGNYKESFLILEEIKFPKEFILNTTIEKFKSYLNERKSNNSY